MTGTKHQVKRRWRSTLSSYWAHKHKPPQVPLSLTHTLHIQPTTSQRSRGKRQPSWQWHGIPDQKGLRLSGKPYKISPLGQV